jgi:hypothetical protein
MIFFVLCYSSQSRLVVVCYRLCGLSKFIITSCLKQFCYLIILLYISNLIFLLTSQCVVIIALCPFLQYKYICIQVYMHKYSFCCFSFPHLILFLLYFILKKK